MFKPTDSFDVLKKKLKRINGKRYSAYRDIIGSYRFRSFRLDIPYTQTDPFSPMTKIKVTVSHRDSQIPESFYNFPGRVLGLEDFLLRMLRKSILKINLGQRGSGFSGVINIIKPGQEVLKRDAVRITHSGIEAIIEMGLPGRGRSVDGKVAESLFFRELPLIVETSLFSREIDLKELELHIKVVEDQEYLRSVMEEKKIIAFVANGAILPRRSGVDERPPVELTENFIREPVETQDGVKIIPFKSPESLEVEINFPNAGRVSGMGIKEGVTLITGGGFHGKSTLLNALVKCVYPHIPYDGREYVITRKDAVFVRAENGRSIKKTDISNFFKSLPVKVSTKEFSTSAASGSTSQAANIMEYLEAGSKLLLVDEDTSATNFMVRDSLMQKIVQNEPIIPFIDRVKEMKERSGISSVIVAGGIGDFVEVADTVILMKNYLPEDITFRAKEIASKEGKRRLKETLEEFKPPSERALIPETFKFIRENKKTKIKITSKREFILNKQKIDLNAVEGIVETSQLYCIGFLLEKLAQQIPEGGANFRKCIDDLFKMIEKEGFSGIIGQRLHGRLALPRKYDLFAAISHLRTLSVKKRKMASKLTT